MNYEKYGVIKNTDYISSQILAFPMSEIYNFGINYEDIIYLGHSRIYKIPVFIDFNILINKHVVALGMTGSGKTHFLKNLILKCSIYQKNSFLIFDWSGEYVELSDYLNSDILNANNFSINLIDLYNIPSFEFIMKSVLNNIAQMNSDEGNIVYESILKFINKGIDLDIQILINYFNSLSKFIIADKLILLSRYNLFDKDSKINLNKLLSGKLCVDLSGFDESTKTQISKLFLILIKGLVYSLDIKTSKTCYIIFDEAWKYINGNSFLKDLFREGRKYGIGLMIATQLTSDVSNEILSNAASIFVFRLHNDDYNLLKSYNITSINNYELSISKLKRGSCFVSLSLLNGGFKHLFIDKIDSFEFSYYKIVVGDNTIKVSKSKFKTIIDKYISSNGYVFSFVNEQENIDLSAFIKALSLNGVKRYIIITILRELGIDDYIITVAYEGIKKNYLE